MTIELKLLVWSAALAFVQMLLAVVGAMLQLGLPALLGNRDNLPKLSGWAGRAMRAHYNMLENLVLFAALVFAAQLAGRTNAMTALGAGIFFYSRLGYAFAYILGIRYLRTLLWTLSVIGLGVIFVQLL
ncbi:MAG: MAPEG family protein [Beijerinckiaceae bacterium]|nr:MAPEG family protein [Beijerinckiaceae bacterium]